MFRRPSISRRSCRKRFSHAPKPPLLTKVKSRKNHLMATHSRCALDHWKWPDDARAAVSLTYDDGRTNHLELAIPDLERFQFRGTFYLTATPGLEKYVSRWRAAFARGHEIGNHSFSHPTRDELSRYDANDILADVGFGALWLKKRFVPDVNRTFAYPYGEVGIGPNHSDRESYANAISRYHRVARTAKGPPNDPFDARLPLTVASASWFDTTDGLHLTDLKGYCETARRHRHWAIIVFHDVIASTAPTGNQICQKTHLEFLAYLKHERFWVAPVKEVANYIFQNLALETRSALGSTANSETAGYSLTGS